MSQGSGGLNPVRVDDFPSCATPSPPTLGISQSSCSEQGTVTITNYSSSLIYRYYETSNPGNNFELTGPSISLSPGVYRFRARIPANCYSDESEVTINSASTQITENLPTTPYVISEGDAPPELKVVGSGSGSSGMDYKWYRNTVPGTNGATLIQGETSNTYTPAVSGAGTYYYYAVLTGCTSVMSNIATLSVISAEPITGSIGIVNHIPGCAGNNSALLQLQLNNAPVDYPPTIE